MDATPARESGTWNMALTSKEAIYAEMIDELHRSHAMLRRRRTSAALRTARRNIHRLLAGVLIGAYPTEEQCRTAICQHQVAMRGI